MATLEEEFNNYPNGFAKHFGNDVSDQKELGGKSWKELLEISRDTFNNGFQKIGFTFDSKEEFNQRKNNKDVQDICLYYRVIACKRRKYYYRNHRLVNSIIECYRNLQTESDNPNNQELPLAE